MFYELDTVLKCVYVLWIKETVYLTAVCHRHESAQSINKQIKLHNISN